MKEKQECKITITETNVSPGIRKYTDQEEYRMNKFSRVCRAKNLLFQWKEPEGCREMSINTKSGSNSSLFCRLVRELQCSKEHGTYQLEFSSLKFNASLPSMD